METATEPKLYTANARRIPNRICPCCGDGIKTGMPIYYVANIYGVRVLNDHGYPARSAVIHKRCLNFHRSQS